MARIAICVEKVWDSVVCKFHFIGGVGTGGQAFVREDVSSAVSFFALCLLGRREDASWSSWLEKEEVLPLPIRLCLDGLRTCFVWLDEWVDASLLFAGTGASATSPNSVEISGMLFWAGGKFLVVIRIRKGHSFLLGTGLFAVLLLDRERG